jgi:phosphoglucomutase
VKADVVMATDPDADRPDRASEWNETVSSPKPARSLHCHNILPPCVTEPASPETRCGKTIVTPNSSEDAESFGARIYDVLTGFKYIAEKMACFERTGETYVFGGEESYGYLIEREVRDKDAVSAAVLTAEVALWCRTKGFGIPEYLERIYEEYFGYFENFSSPRP